MVIGAEFAHTTRSSSELSNAAPAEIAFKDVVKRYPGRASAAVENLTFEVPPGEICVLIGPSGCGKTTALKMVNRLITITEGDITIDGRSVRQLDLSQLRRGIGYVFQQIGLFPHMTVENNIGTVPAAARLAERPHPSTAPASCSSSWGSTRARTSNATRGSSRAVSSSASASPGRWPPTPRSC